MISYKSHFISESMGLGEGERNQMSIKWKTKHDCIYFHEEA